MQRPTSHDEKYCFQTFEPAYTRGRDSDLREFARQPSISRTVIFRRLTCQTAKSRSLRPPTSRCPRAKWQTPSHVVPWPALSRKKLSLGRPDGLDLDQGQFGHWLVLV